MVAACARHWAAYPAPKWYCDKGLVTASLKYFRGQGLHTWFSAFPAPKWYFIGYDLGQF
jgi:hypothetical protein